MQLKCWQLFFFFHSPKTHHIHCSFKTILLYPDGYKKVVWFQDGNATYLHGRHCSFKTILLYPDGYKKVVWFQDGNATYLHGRHIPLFITALLFGVTVLPFVLVLTFIPCLQKKLDMPLLFWPWVTRLKPLFYTYTGPYKNICRFWTSLAKT